jgi:hypothetical protein
VVLRLEAGHDNIYQLGAFPFGVAYKIGFLSCVRRGWRTDRTRCLAKWWTALKRGTVKGSLRRGKRTHRRLENNDLLLPLSNIAAVMQSKNK